MACRIGTNYQSGSGNMAYSCADRKEADSYSPGSSYQLDRTTVLLFLW